MKTNWITKETERPKSSFLKLVEKIDKNHNKPTRYKGTIETMLLEFFGKTSKKRYTWKRETFKRLLIHLYNQKNYAILRDYKSVAVLHNISAFGNQMVRNVEDWESKGFDKELQLRSLIKHSFALYETPIFLENAFFGCNKRHMHWYVQLGKGKSIKELSALPISLTKKMAHEFKNAPVYFEANQALRFAQALGFGASVKTAKIIGFSQLSIITNKDEKFWVTVVHFFSNETELSGNDLDEIIDYLDFKFRENQSFSMKGRTKKALLNQAKDWKRNIYRDEIGNVLSWENSNIKPFYKEEIEKGRKVVYETVELLNSLELYDEGNAMYHCVAEYDEYCKAGKIAIVSLRKRTEIESVKRLVTIEIGLKEKEIFEAKAKYNEEPDAKSLELIDLWIKKSGIKKNVEIMDEMPEGQQNNARAIHTNNYGNDDDYNIAMIAKVIFWVIYFIIKAMA